MNLIKWLKGAFPYPEKQLFSLSKRKSSDISLRTTRRFSPIQIFAFQDVDGCGGGATVGQPSASPLVVVLSAVVLRRHMLLSVSHLQLFMVFCCFWSVTCCFSMGYVVVDWLRRSDAVLFFP